MSVKVLMPSDRVRMSPETYREYALSYKSLAGLLRKTSEDTAKIVPFPANVWSGEAPQRFTAMMTQITGAATTAADMSSVLSLYYGQLADTAASFNGLLKSLAVRFKACESQIKDAEKHSGGWGLSGLVDAVDDFVSKSPEELRSTQRQIAASMADIHAEWQRLDSAMSSDIRNKYMPAFQAAMDMLPFKYKSAATVTPTKPRPDPASRLGLTLVAERAEEVRNIKTLVSHNKAVHAFGPPAEHAAEHARELYPTDLAKQKQFVEDYMKKLDTLAQSRGVKPEQFMTTIVGYGGMNATPDTLVLWPSVLSVRDLSAGGLPADREAARWSAGSWTVSRGDSLWSIAKTTLEMSMFMNPTPSDIKNYVADIRAANGPGALLPGTHIRLPVPSSIQDNQVLEAAMSHGYTHAVADAISAGLLDPSNGSSESRMAQLQEMRDNYNESRAQLYSSMLPGMDPASTEGAYQTLSSEYFKALQSGSTPAHAAATALWRSEGVDLGMSDEVLEKLKSNWSEDVFVAKFLNGADLALPAGSPTIPVVLDLMDDMYERGAWNPGSAQ